MLLNLTSIFFILFSRELTVNQIDVQGSTLEGPPQINLGAGPLAVLHLKNQLYNLQIDGIKHSNIMDSLGDRLYFCSDGFCLKTI